jgi:2-desacetyl-2-hydroxyethyl bacteriochlorophyllide A dehydrogenase
MISMSSEEDQTHHRRAAYMGDATIVVDEARPVAPANDEVRIHVAYTGICGTDLHILHGAMDGRVTVPAILGHEMSGTIADVGAGVRGWAVGDQVTVMPLDSCGHCPACSRGFSHVCQRLNFMGIDSNGSMQSSWTVPAGMLVRVPPELPLQLAALIEPTAVAVHDVRRGDVRPGDKAVVVGGGPVGLLVALAAKAIGAEVVVVELDERRRALADSMGLRVLDPASDVVAAVEEWTAGAGADVAFEVSGSAAGIATATQVLAVRGRLVLVGIHAVPREVDLFRVFWRELTVIGARVYEARDFATAATLLTAGDIPGQPLISHVVPLDATKSAFAALERGEGMKILIDCQAELGAAR